MTKKSSTITKIPEFVAYILSIITDLNHIIYKAFRIVEKYIFILKYHERINSILKNLGKIVIVDYECQQFRSK